MDNSKDFMDFYNNPYSKEMTKNFGLIADYAATVLSSFSNMLENVTKDDEESRNLSDYCRNMINSLTAQLQRTGIFCSAILSDNAKLQQIKAEKYLNDFVSGCKRVLGEKCQITAAVQQDFIAVTSSELLDMLLLGFIRKCCASEGSKPSILTSFDISAAIKNDIPQITADAGGLVQQANYDPFGMCDFFEHFFNEFASLIAEKLHLQIDVAQNHMTIKFIPSDHDDMITFHSTRVQLANEGRSLFRIMLDDFGSSQP